MNRKLVHTHTHTHMYIAVVSLSEVLFIKRETGANNKIVPTLSYNTQ